MGREPCGECRWPRSTRSSETRIPGQALPRGARPPSGGRGGLEGDDGGHGQLPQVCSLLSELDFHLWTARLKMSVLNLTAAAWCQHIGDATEQTPAGQGAGAPEPAGPGALFQAGLSRRHPGLAASLAGGLHTLKCHLLLCRSISSFSLVLYEFYGRS